VGREPTVGFLDEITVKSPFSTPGLVAAAENYRLSFWIEGESKSPDAILSHLSRLGLQK
jgi:hypothetical protein